MSAEAAAYFLVLDQGEVQPLAELVGVEVLKAVQDVVEELHGCVLAMADDHEPVDLDPAQLQPYAVVLASSLPTGPGPAVRSIRMRLHNACGDRPFAPVSY